MMRILFNNIKRFETDLKWINVLQTAFSLELMIIFIMKVTYQKCQIFMCFFFFSFRFRKRKSRYHGKRQNENDKH